MGLLRRDRRKRRSTFCASIQVPWRLALERIIFPRRNRELQSRDSACRVLAPTGLSSLGFDHYFALAWDVSLGIGIESATLDRQTIVQLVLVATALLPLFC